MSSTLKSLTVPALSLALVGFAIGSSLTTAGCSKSRRTVTTTGTGQFVQVERLARPAVNEGLVQTNAFLNAFNSIHPNQDLSTLTDPANAAFFNEVVANLQAVDGLDASDDVVDGDIVQAFLPDVMRVDSTQSVPVGTGAYAFGALSVGTVVRPISGRKLEDDVIDITLTVIAGSAVSDNVDYRDGTLNDGAGQIDHDLLNGQAAPNGAASFPFLAPAN